VCARGSGTCATHIVAQTSQEIDIKIPSKLRFHPRLYPYNLLNYNVFSSMPLSSDLRHYCILRSANRDLPCKATQNHQVNRQFEQSSAAQKYNGVQSFKLNRIHNRLLKRIFASGLILCSVFALLRSDFGRTVGQVVENILAGVLTMPSNIN
jgi:hypothetical protein